MSWKNETCEDCEFRVDFYCRESPPCIKPDDGHEYVIYPIVEYAEGEEIEYMPACSKWQPKED